MLPDARRYLMVIQDPRGYLPPDAPLEIAPPDGPISPIIYSVVLADDYDEVRAEVVSLTTLLDTYPQT